MKTLIDKHLQYLETLTKDEADFIRYVLDWNDEERMAFRLAKRFFEEEINANKPQAE